MAINFPGSPSVNQIFSDPTSGFTYQWNGTVWVNYNYTSPAKILELDDIRSSFDGLTQTFALTVSGSAVSPVKADQLTINVGGILQNPGVDYTISGSNIVFTTAPDAGLDFYGVLLGGSTNLTGAASTSVNPLALTPGAPSWNTSGDLLITGVTTIANTGTASTALTVLGGARITGILTVGSSSITIDGANNEISVGTGVTLSTSGITVGIITGVFYGDGSGLDNVGVGSEGSINTTGIITASSFYGDGSGLVNLGGPLSVLTFQPSNGSTDVGLTTNITLTFNKPIKANTGTITLRTDSASGTIIESYDVTSSDRLTINGGVLTIDPTDSLSGLTTYFVVLPAGVYKDDFESSSSAVVDTYSFTTELGAFEGELFAWGSNTYGKLGQDNTTSYSSPRQVSGTTWSTISISSGHSLATKSDGSLWIWGTNGDGRLGQNDLTQYSSPVQIPGTQWSSVAAGYVYCLATKNDNTLWAWGSNSAYLGQNNNTQYSSPVQIPGTQWSFVKAKIYNNAAIKTDGTLWTWGGDGHGASGNNTATPKSSPIQIPGTQWSSVDTGYYCNFALKTDGTLWSWGRNDVGIIGKEDLVPRSSPVQVPGTLWRSVSAGYYSPLATKTDETLWSWGRNTFGQLGQNDTTDYSSPVQVPGTEWGTISDGGSNHSLVTKSDGTLWVWGYNSSGQLGQSNTTSYSSPIQILGNQWNSVSGSNNHSSALKQV